MNATDVLDRWGHPLIIAEPDVIGPLHRPGSFIDVRPGKMIVINDTPSWVSALLTIEDES